MSKIASFLDFLRSGSMGKLSANSTPAQVAQHLGVPGGHLLQAEDTWPLYWCYGDHIEIAFRPDSNGKMTFFQIERAQWLKGDFFAVGDNMVVTLDGFRGDMRPSEFLTYALSHNIACSVTPYFYKYGGDTCYMDLWISFASGVSLTWNSDSQYQKVLNKVVSTTATDKKPNALSWILTRLDPHCESINSIYCHPVDPHKQNSQTFDKNLSWQKNIYRDGSSYGLKASPRLSSTDYLKAMEMDNPETKA